MTQADFILERLPLYPASAVARMAGCSVERVNAVRDLAQVVAAPAVRAPVVVAPPPPPPERPKWRPSLPPLARRVLLDTAAKHGCTLNELLAPSKRPGRDEMSGARQEAWSGLRAVTDANGDPLYSLPRIGDWFGGKDHTTILYGIRRHEAIRDGLPPPHKPYKPIQRAIYRARLRAEKAAALAELHARIAWRESGRDL